MKKYVENVLIIFMPVFVREKLTSMACEAVKWQKVFDFLRAFKVKEMADTVHQS